jgi:sugar-specific transcriptional regulator TrmB
MNKELEITLEQIGLNEREAKVYLAALELGESTVLPISKKCGIKRTYCYDILTDLQKRGLVAFYEKNGRRRYFAEDPKKLENLLREKLNSFKSVLPDLQAIFNRPNEKPRVRFYEGTEGLKQIYEETLSLKPEDEMLAFGQATLIHQLFGDEWVENYLERRKKRRIFQRAIVEDSPLARAHQKNDENENRETILIPQDQFPFANEINIFGNKISIVSFEDQIGVVIESQNVAKTQRSIFELSWRGAKSLAEDSV